MLRSNEKLKLPWSGRIENDYYLIRDSENKIVTVIQYDIENNGSKIGNFILRSANRKSINDALLDKIENIVLVTGGSILLLVIISILFGIEYSPMLILAGGLLLTASFIYQIRSIQKKQKDKHHIDFSFKSFKSY